jgi:hypothetical protein
VVGWVDVRKPNSKLMNLNFFCLDEFLRFAQKITNK